MRPEHFYGLLAATVAAHIVIAHTGVPAVTTGRLHSTTLGTQHVLESHARDLRFDTANVAALRHLMPDGAAALALQDQQGIECGAVGYKGKGANPSYLDGAVYLAGGRIEPGGTRPGGGPIPIILGGEGWLGGSFVTSRRLHFKDDWSVAWNTPENRAHTTITHLGGWRFSVPPIVPALHFAAGPDQRAGSVVLTGAKSFVENRSVTPRTLVFLTRHAAGSATLSYSTAPESGFTILSSDPSEHGEVAYLLIDVVP